jgi:hypothetical protein
VSSDVVPERLPDALPQAGIVLVCQDATKPVLAPLFSSSYLVLKRSLDFFLLQIRNHVQVVHLKPSSMPADVVADSPSSQGHPQTSQATYLLLASLV